MDPAAIAADTSCMPWNGGQSPGPLPIPAGCHGASRHERTCRLWREAYVAAPLGDRAVEGYVDLLYEGPDGLVIVDYKTDAVTDGTAVDAKLGQYRLPLATYAEALAVSTGMRVVAARLVFCRAAGASERDVPDLDGARAEVRALLGDVAPTPT